MEDNAKCFIRIKKGVYEEITYKELEERRRTDKKYRNKRFIYIHKMLMEVSKKEYEQYYKEIERNRYAERVLRKLSDISIEQQKREDEEDMKSKDIVKDANCDIEFEVTRKIQVEKLKNALLKLEPEEYKLIEALFYDEKTLREYAKVIGKSYGTVLYRERQILEKLKKLLKK